MADDTTTPTTPKTLLQAVNQMLKAIRVSPVMSLLPESLNADASDAKAALDEVSIEIQSEGWFCNTEFGSTIDPDVDGSISLPANLLKLRVARRSSGARLVERGAKLYDPTKRTFTIGEPVIVDMVVGLVYEDLPQPLRAYITAIAARRFCIPKLPTGATFRYTEETVKSALTSVLQMDDEHRDDTMHSTSPHIQKMTRR